MKKDMVITAIQDNTQSEIDDIKFDISQLKSNMNYLEKKTNETNDKLSMLIVCIISGLVGFMSTLIIRLWLGV